MKVAVAGGTGFLGKHVVEAFDKSGHEVYGVGSKQYNLLSPTTAMAMVQELKPDVVVHLAALCGGIGANVKRPADFWRDNLLMGINIMEACRFFGRKLLCAGTTCSYSIHTPIPFKEEDIFNGYPEPTNAPYGIAKRSLIVGGNAYSDQFGLDIRFLMPTNLYGPYDSTDLETNHVIPALILKFMKAKDEGAKSVELWGDGTPTRDFLFVTDAAQAFLKAAESMIEEESPKVRKVLGHKIEEWSWKILNIGTGHEVSIADLAEVIKRVVGYEGRLTWNGKLGGQPRRVLDSSAAKESIGWEATTPLNEGIQSTVDWMKEQLVDVG